MLYSVTYTFPTIINDLSDDVICNIVIYADNTTHNNNLWQQLELVSELVSGLRRSRLGQKVTCWFQCWKNSAFLLDWSNNMLTTLITLFTWKWMGLLLKKNNLLKCSGWLEPLPHCRNIASISLFYRYYLRRCSLELAQLVHHSWMVQGCLCQQFLSSLG